MLNGYPIELNVKGPSILLKIIHILNVHIILKCAGKYNKHIFKVEIITYTYIKLSSTFLLALYLSGGSGEGLKLSHNRVTFSECVSELS